jgi:hypothetical protein
VRVPDLYPDPRVETMRPYAIVVTTTVATVGVGVIATRRGGGGVRGSCRQEGMQRGQ